MNSSDYAEIGKAVREEITVQSDVSHEWEEAAEFVETVRKGPNADIGEGVVRAIERLGWKVVRS